MDGIIGDVVPAPSYASPSRVFDNGHHRDSSLLMFSTGATHRVAPGFRWLDLGRRAAAMAAALVIFMGAAGAGTVSAALDSLPGDLLYPVKTVTEQAQIALTFSDAGRVSIHMTLAERRLFELSQVTDAHLAGQVAEAYDRNVAVAASLASKSASEGKASVGAFQIENQIARQQQTLQDLVKSAPDEAQVAVAVALSAANQAATQIALTTKTTSTSEASGMSGAAPVASPPSDGGPGGAGAPPAGPLAPLGGPAGSGATGVLSGPQPAPTGGFSFPTEKGPVAASPAPEKGLLPVAPLPAVPAHTGDGSVPVAPVSSGGAATALPPVEGSAASSPAQTPAASAAEASPPAASTTAPPNITPDKPPVISTLPPAIGVPDGKDGSLTQPAPVPRPYIVGK